jgi:hypothetical protein
MLRVFECQWTTLEASSNYFSLEGLGRHLCFLLQVRHGTMRTTRLPPLPRPSFTPTLLLLVPRCFVWVLYRSLSSSKKLECRRMVFARFSSLPQCSSSSVLCSFASATCTHASAPTTAPKRTHTTATAARCKRDETTYYSTSYPQ